MNIHVNGVACHVKTSSSLAEFLASSEFNVPQVVVAINMNFIHKHQYETVFLQEQDQLEILSAVVGG